MIMIQIQNKQSIHNNNTTNMPMSLYGTFFFLADERFLFCNVLLFTDMIECAYWMLNINGSVIYIKQKSSAVHDIWYTYCTIRITLAVQRIMNPGAGCVHASTSAVGPIFFE